MKRNSSRLAPGALVNNFIQTTNQQLITLYQSSPPRKHAKITKSAARSEGSQKRKRTKPTLRLAEEDEDWVPDTDAHSDADMNRNVPAKKTVGYQLFPGLLKNLFGSQTRALPVRIPV